MDYVTMQVVILLSRMKDKESNLLTKLIIQGCVHIRRRFLLPRRCELAGIVEDGQTTGKTGA